jgi:hypothetical protein
MGITVLIIGFVVVAILLVEILKELEKIKDILAMTDRERAKYNEIDSESHPWE